MGNQLYALVTEHCNLSCPHCDIKKPGEVFNKTSFIKAIDEFDGKVILFGGEPTLYLDRLYEIYDHDRKNGQKIKTISTNLINLNDRLIEMYRELGNMASSWNPNRFTKDQYNTWVKNCNTLAENGLETAVLVTLTNDLFDMGAEAFLKVAAEWNPRAIKYIRFEHCVDMTNTKEYYERSDEFLCDVYIKWDIPIENATINSVKRWYYDCSNVYSLFPDGNIRPGCPHYDAPLVPTECYTCEKSAVCRPCRFQIGCSYPKKFADLVNKGGV